MKNPEIFQGNLKRAATGRAYFEGWYYKQVTAGREQVLSIIPGVSFGKAPHSFIQVIDGKQGTTWYVRFPLDAFSCDPSILDVSVGENRFSKNGLHLDLHDEDLDLSGSLTFSGMVSWKPRFLAPGIMGWYQYVPFMECYHGLVSVKHDLTGVLRCNGRSLDFAGGKGYIEKDWGRAFPSAWIWLHSNSFSDDTASFMLSIARIPWLGRSFTGFLGYFYVDGVLTPLATWQRHKIRDLTSDEDSLSLRIVLNRHEFIHISAVSRVSGALHAPEDGDMDRIIKESVNADLRLDVNLKNYQGVLEGGNAGYEAVHPESL